MSSKKRKPSFFRSTNRKPSSKSKTHPEGGRVAYLLEKHQAEVWTGGVRCRTCFHPKVKKINQDCLEFLEIRKAQGIGSNMPWSAFIKLVLSAHNYQMSSTSLIKHLRKCLKIEVVV